MSAGMNAGQGQCQGTARLLVKPVQSVIELGAGEDVLMKALNAVHHANRHAPQGDFIAIALPEMRMGRNCMLPGHEIELVGSEACLSRFLDLEGPQTLKRRGMLLPCDIEEAFHDPGMIGAAYVRDRTCEKNTEGWLRRNKARAERRGKPWKDMSAKPKGHDRSALALRYGSAVLHIRQVIAEMTDIPLMVSTYGFSGTAPGMQAVLPVLPQAARGDDDAA